MKMKASQNSVAFDEASQAKIQELIAVEVNKALARSSDTLNDRYETNLRQRVICLEERTEDLKDLMMEVKERVVKLEEKSIHQMQLIDERFAFLTKSINERFAAVDKRFEDLIRNMNERFATVDKRFEDMDKRFNDMNKRFDDMNKRFDDMNKQFNHLIRTLKWMFTFGISMIAVLMTVYKFLDKLL